MTPIVESYQGSESVDRFCRQYLQLERDLDFPSPTLLREEHIQNELYRRIFSDRPDSHPPPPRYKLRVLKELVKRIEASIDDWDRYVSKKATTMPFSLIVLNSLNDYLFLFIFLIVCCITPSSVCLTPFPREFQMS